MVSPRPPHSAWLPCQHQASRAIKQLAPFINLTSTIFGKGKEKVQKEEKQKGCVDLEASFNGQTGVPPFVCWRFFSSLIQT